MTKPKKTQAKIEPPAKTAEAPAVPFKDRVWEAFDDLLAAYAGGWSLEYAVAMHMGADTDSYAVRLAIKGNTVMRNRWSAVREARAATFFEKSASMARTLEGQDPGKAGELYLKLAAKTCPAMYGDRATLELTGADGGPIESVIKLDPAEAYRRAVGRA